MLSDGGGGAGGGVVADVVGGAIGCREQGVEGLKHVSEPCNMKSWRYKIVS